MDLSDLEDYVLKNFKSCWYSSILIDNFRKVVWTVLMKNKKTPTTKYSFEIFLKLQKYRRFWLKLMIEKKLYINFLLVFQKKVFIISFTCYTSNGAVFAKKFIRRLRKLLEELVFQENSGNWKDEIKLLRQRQDKAKHFSSKLTPIQPSLEKNEGYVCQKC